MIEKEPEKPKNIQRLDTSLDPTKEEERMEKIQEATRRYREKYAEFDILWIYNFNDKLF